MSIETRPIRRVSRSLTATGVPSGRAVGSRQRNHRDHADLVGAVQVASPYPIDSPAARS